MSIAKPLEAEGYRFSYDMLGEAAFTADDAKKYFASYKSALKKLGARATGGDVFSQAVDLGEALGAASPL